MPRRAMRGVMPRPRSQVPQVGVVVAWSPFSFAGRRRRDAPHQRLQRDVVVPGRAPSSTSARRTQDRTVSVEVTPNLAATAFIADHSLG
ncbi:hypothetical protein SAMN06265355_1277 [Actinomadura mexicana]|uniref:Uncharacterized protein n=1 Tax=Actinomadura mexicana TaxID=134959 RepID=A0A239GZ29_9ACTN|nr:hypothetical protein SAMN06265355_1277 [Actinomadura mexicana]